MRRQIKLTKKDALTFLKHGLQKWPRKTLIYLDPPYFEQGRELYYDYYKSDDHVALAHFVKQKMRRRSWIVSYDNAPKIKELYESLRSIVYDVGYTARENRTGREIMFFSPTIEIPNLVGPVRQIGKIREAA